jgi:hypothetical protein
MVLATLNTEKRVIFVAACTLIPVYSRFCCGLLLRDPDDPEHNRTKNEQKTTYERCSRDLEPPRAGKCNHGLSLGNVTSQ